MTNLDPALLAEVLRHSLDGVAIVEDPGGSSPRVVYANATLAPLLQQPEEWPSGRLLEEMGMEDQVTLFSASDFGRTLSSNGDGTDHAWGGNHFALGGGVQGGRLYGEYPEDLSLGNALDTGRGRLVPTTSVDEYFAELALWLGVQPSDLGAMLPNLDRFYDVNSGAKPIGML